MKIDHDQQQRVLGRILAQYVSGDSLAAQAAGDRSVTSALSIYTAGSATSVADVAHFPDAPSA